MHMTSSGGESVDVLIAGGGVAGSATAAALSRLGLNILIVEPVPNPGRRLAGELIHPPGIDGLCELGLMDPDDLPGCPVNGFAVFPFAGDRRPTVLPYGEIHGRVRYGRTIEHNELKEHLLETVQTLSGVRAWLGARVTGMTQDADGNFVATVNRNDQPTEVRAKLIVGADGPMSQIRKMAGVDYETRRYSGMSGVEVDASHLPNPGYGNIFLNPAGVSYAYGIGGGRARVMFEVLKGDDARESVAAHLARFPAAFRADIERVLATGKPLAAANYCIVPDASIKANLALVGDARGCCHPLTASGITAAVKDALLLADALRDNTLDVAAALGDYAKVCDRLQLTRRTLAEELREAFLARTPEAALLNQCIFAYWRSSPKGRSRSMALLSTLDTSIFSLASQYGLVGMQAIRLLPQWIRNRALLKWHLGIYRMVGKSLSFQRAALGIWLRALRSPA